MLANAKALAAGAEEVRTEIEGAPWVQKPFPYQGKCVEWVRGEFAALPPGDRDWVMTLLSGTGCKPLLG